LLRAWVVAPVIIAIDYEEVSSDAVQAIFFSISALIENDHLTDDLIATLWPTIERLAEMAPNEFLMCTPYLNIQDAANRALFEFQS
jgi:hypothetical protein